jgi:hypothetical protein
VGSFVEGMIQQNGGRSEIARQPLEDGLAA